MQPKNDRQALPQKQSQRKRLSALKLVSNSLQRLIICAPIRWKISLGYALVLSIAVLGTTTGQLVGNFYTKKAWDNLNLEEEKAELLSELKIAVLETKSHQQKLVILMGYPELFNQQNDEYIKHKKQVNHLFLKLKILVSQNFNQDDRGMVELNQFLQTYDKTQTVYSQKLDELLKGIEPQKSSPEKLIASQQLLWKFTKSQSAIQFNQLSEDLTKLVNLAYQGQDKAEISLEQAREILKEISIASFLISVIFATIFALYISRMISQPIEALTQVAEQATKESNFSLQAAVTTQDEVGGLTISFNSLIQSVKEHIEALEISNQNLENRVEERTQELTQKNDELHSACAQLAEALQNLQQTQSQLIQAEKMSSLGQMVAGIAHEINNPVSFIYSNLDHAGDYAQNLLGLVKLYQKDYPNPSDAIKDEIQAIDLDFMAEDFAKIINSMKNGAERIRQIVLSLRNFSRLDESQLKFANIHEGIDSTLAIVNQRLEGKITVIKEYGNLPLVKCYPALLNQVFMNIIDNAIAAIEERKIKGNYESNGTQEPKIWIYTEIINDDQFKIGIKDNGIGIPPELKDKVFDHFFTTKDVGKGTGLGLTVCYQVVEKHNGNIDFFSAVGEGTEFWITLPIKPVQN
jgi:two-component system NtrC family sensor kinase